MCSPLYHIFDNFNLIPSFCKNVVVVLPVPFRAAPTSCRLNVVVRFPPLSREVGQNDKTTTPKSPTIRSLLIVWNAAPLPRDGRWRNSMRDPTVELYPKVWTRGQKWHAGDAPTLLYQRLATSSW